MAYLRDFEHLENARDFGRNVADRRPDHSRELRARFSHDCHLDELARATCGDRLTSASVEDRRPEGYVRQYVVVLVYLGDGVLHRVSDLQTQYAQLATAF